LNRRRAEGLAQKLDERRQDLAKHIAAVKTDAARLAGYAPLARDAAQAVVFTGRFRRAAYSVERYLLPVDSRYAIPLLAFVPDQASSKVVLYLHPKGKNAEAAAGREIESLVEQGCIVIAPDMIGMPGEIGPGVVAKPEAGPPRLWYGYVLLGKSMVGRQMADVMRVVRFAESRFKVSPKDLVGFARGECGPILLHTAAIEGVFGQLALVEAPLSYRSLVMTPDYAPHYLTEAVPGALTAYDLPDLVACAAPRKVLVAAPRDSRGAPADAATIAQETAVMTRAYAGNSARLKVTSLQKGDSVAWNAALAEWLR
jgi:hypothetical protein